MKTHLYVAIAAATLVAAPARATDHAECSHLVMLKLPDVKVTDATSVAAATAGGVRVAHCRVNGVIGSETHFTLLLPCLFFPYRQ